MRGRFDDAPVVDPLLSEEWPEVWLSDDERRRARKPSTKPTPVPLKTIYDAIQADHTASMLLERAGRAWDRYYRHAETAAARAYAKAALWTDTSAEILYDWVVERYGEPTARYGEPDQPRWTTIYVIYNTATDPQRHRRGVDVFAGKSW